MHCRYSIKARFLILRYQNLNNLLSNFFASFNFVDKSITVPSITHFKFPFNCNNTFRFNENANNTLFIEKSKFKIRDIIFRVCGCERISISFISFSAKLF